jgi:glycine betaine/choline ABC-type transport system substrate-binding protein
MGTKPFSEHEILAEVVQGVLTEHDIAMRPPYRCDDTFDCERALQSGYIDMMVEYTGTALHLIGAPPPGQDVSTREWLDGLYGPMGARWLVELGFDNGYVWLMPATQASATSVRTLSDLHSKETPLRVAVPPEYLRRPRDGLLAVAERYGLDLDPQPLAIADPLERYQATLEGRADVAVGYATDGNLEELGFTILEDDLGFFSDYEAAIVVRENALAAEPGLEPALRELEGQIDTPTMRALNRSVVIGGEPAAVVARRFLLDHDLVAEDTVLDRLVSLKVAYSSEATRRAFGTQALGAIRQAFPERAVEFKAEESPLTAIDHGEARLGVVGAEAFFREDRRGRIVRRQGVEAIAVLGRRILHVVARSGADSTALQGKVGVPNDGDEARLAKTMLRFGNNTPAQMDDVGALLAAVRSGSLDAALIAAPQGDPELTEALRDGLTLVSMSDWLDAERQLRFPFMRPVRLRPGTYPNQEQTIDTLSSQVLLVAPSETQVAINAGGPAGAVPAGAQPLTDAERKALAAGVGTSEAPDPAIPSAWSLTRQHHEETPGSRWVDRLLNAFVIAFLAWLAVIVLDPRKIKRFHVEPVDHESETREVPGPSAAE